MTTYLTPGLYVERFDATAPKITPLRTDVTGFVGLAERGPIDTPLPIESLRQFESHFGRPIGGAYLALVVRAFLENGGRRCWVVRVAGGPAGSDASAAATSTDATGTAIGLSISAATAGTWGNELTVELREVRKAQTLIPAVENGASFSTVTSVGGFERHSFVRLRQPLTGMLVPDVYRVVSDVDAAEARLLWVNDDVRKALPSDTPLSGLVSGQPVMVERLAYEIFVRRAGRLVATYRDLSAAHSDPRWFETLLGPVYDAPADEVQRRTVRTPRLIEVHDQRAGELDPLAVPSGPVFLTGGSDGVESLTWYDFVGEEPDPRSSEQVQRQHRRGVWALDLADEVFQVAVPDIHIRPTAEPPPLDPLVCPASDPCRSATAAPATVPIVRASAGLPPTFDEQDIYRVQAEMISHCESRGDRIALLDPPADSALGDALGLSGVRAWRKLFESKFAALYWPWVCVQNPGRSSSELTRAIPPSGHVAGCIAATDIDIGIHQAPANVALKWVEDLSAGLDDASHGVLNPEGINGIRVLPGRGIRIFGARTVSSDPDARFLPVRRLVLMVIKAVRVSTQWSVFEPNTVYTRAKLRVALTSFLSALWQSGALAGNNAAEAFFVRCDESNNPAESRDAGRLVVEIGIAPSVPFEFVVLRIGRVEQGLEVTESSGRASR